MSTGTRLAGLFVPKPTPRRGTLQHWLPDLGATVRQRPPMCADGRWDRYSVSYSASFRRIANCIAPGSSGRSSPGWRPGSVSGWWVPPRSLTLKPSLPWMRATSMSNWWMSHSASSPGRAADLKWYQGGE